MTGVPIRDSGDGIYDDGEWVSWAYINEQIALQEAGEAAETETGEAAEPQGAELLGLLLDAIAHSAKSSEPSTLWGRIGELYVAERFGVELSRALAQGHDGRLGDDLVEIKTITRAKKRPVAIVKRAGNFNLLAVVRVDDDYRLDARLISREKLQKGNGGKLCVVSWRTACRLGTSTLPARK